MQQGADTGVCPFSFLWKMTIDRLWIKPYLSVRSARIVMVFCGFAVGDMD